MNEEIESVKKIIDEVANKIENNEFPKEYDKEYINNNYKNKLDQIIDELKEKKAKIENTINDSKKTNYRRKKGEIPIVDADTPITAYDFIKKKKKNEYY